MRWGRLSSSTSPGYPLQGQPEKATSGFEPLLREKADGLGDSLEPSVGDVPELNPFLARVLERLRENERERSR